MLLQSDYTTGTVSISAGGTALTGVGTQWNSAGLQPGDEFIADGWRAIIASINSNTSITLEATGVRGSALSGAAYRIRYQPDVSRVAAQTRQLIDLLASGNLTALAAINGTGGDWGVHLTGAGTMARHAQTSFGRAIAGLTGTAGSFIRASGAGAAVMQAIVGTASQSGGTPTGAIIGRGANANGEWVRFADGTQLCWHVLTHTGTVTGGWRTTWSMPAAFSSSFPRPVLIVPNLTASGITAAQRRQISVASSSAAASPFIDVYTIPDSTIDPATNSLDCFVVAIGRWF